MILVDTTVIIDLWRGRTGVRECLAKNEGENFYISAITIEEIYDGLGYTKIKKGVESYDQIKDQHEKILNDFHVMPLSMDIIRKSGLLRGELRAKGVIIDIADVIIMAASHEMGAKKIITRNPNHFKEAQVPVESYKI